MPKDKPKPAPQVVSDVKALIVRGIKTGAVTPLKEAMRLLDTITWGEHDGREGAKEDKTKAEE
ncbi:hypothetical protein LCGC14_1036200 [marine sediment metagenome]|uniref:Uncharacterized protein n=1 Tax=marine sediment metagenome TaxID=412755 RepID=A0A0F9NER1_9ZZZZ